MTALRKAPVLPLLLWLSFRCAAPAQTSTQPVRIHFEGRLEDKLFACGRSYEGVGKTGSTVTPADLRFFVSDVELLAADGTATPITLDQDGIWQYKSLALIDLEDGSGGCRNGNPEMHAEVDGKVPAGSYVGLRFTLGVPFALDHIDESDAPSPLNMTAMLWNWQNGYKFLRAEVLTVPTVPPPPSLQHTADRPGAPGPMRKPAGVSGFPVHIGSTGCVAPSPTSAPPSDCKNPNRALITLPAFDPGKDVVVLDLGRLLAHSDLSMNSRQTSPGCMSFPGDPDCAPIMEALGLPYDDAPAKPQVVFYRSQR